MYSFVPGLMTSAGHPHMVQYEGQGYHHAMHAGMLGSSPRDPQTAAMVAVVPQHILQNNPEVLKGEASPKMAAVEVLDLTKREDELRMKMLHQHHQNQTSSAPSGGGSGSGGGDAPLDLSVKKSDKNSDASPTSSSGYVGSEHLNPNWGPHLMRMQETSRSSPHIKSLEYSLQKHLQGVDKPVYPSEILNRPPLGMAPPHPLGMTALRGPLTHGGITAGQPLQQHHPNATAEQMAALSMRLGMTREAFHANQQQQMAAAAAQQRFEAQQQQHHNATLLQKYVDKLYSNFSNLPLTKYTSLVYVEVKPIQ